MSNNAMRELCCDFFFSSFPVEMMLNFPLLSLSPLFKYTNNSTLNSSLNNGVSTIYTTSNTNNIVEQINHHLTTNNWRTSSNPINTSNQNVVRGPQASNTLTFTNTSGASGGGHNTAKRKSGADRLFAYFEADDSEDLELDYAR